MTGEGGAAGLCGDCRHARRIRSARGSTFHLCARAAADPRYARYPPLPVLRCPGHEPASPAADGGGA
ncbi:MAG: hypothetical protein SF182_25765 [Deltaproteobacteria bacterium]|nr:hypothetical protein [Deltaproteobacteria bacterium]